MDDFLGGFNLNSLITCKEIEAVTKSLPTKKYSWPDCFSEEFYKTFREDLIPTLLKIFHKVATERTLPISFFELL